MTESHIWRKNGVKFVYLSGDSPYDIGFEHGRLLKDDAVRLMEGIKKASKDRYGSTKSKLLSKLVLMRSKSLKNSLTQDSFNELKGMSDASGIDIKWGIFANMSYEMAVFLNSRFNIGGACSFFVASWQNSDNVVIGKTTDLVDTRVNPFLADLFSGSKSVFIYDCKWLKKKFITFSYTGCISGDSIIFDNGDVFALNDGGWPVEKRFSLKKTPIIPIMKEVAKESDNIPNMLENLKKYESMKSYACLMSDGSKKNSFLVEMCKGDYHVKGFNGHLINTNHFKSEEMVKKHYKRNYSRNQRYKDTFKRFKNIESNIREISDIKEAAKMLEIHEGTFDSRKGSISNSKTSQAFVYLPKDRRLLIPNGSRHPVTLSGDWVEFGLDEIFNHTPN